MARTDLGHIVMKGVVCVVYSREGIFALELVTGVRSIQGPEQMKEIRYLYVFK